MEEQSRNKHRIQNPRENANIFSVLTFFYTLPTFFYGYRKAITEDDLYETFSEHKSSKLGNVAIELWNAELENAKKKRRKPSLYRILVKLYIWEYLLIVLGVAVSELIIKTYQAVLLGELVSCYSTSDETVSANPRFYAFGIIVGSLMQFAICHPYVLGSYHLALKVRVVCCSLIYEKVLKLNKAALSQTTPGQIINLVSNDINVFDKFFFSSAFVWIALPQTSVVLYLTYQEVGVSSVFGVSLLLLFIPLYFFLGKLTSKYRLKVSVKRDERLRLMNEVIQGIGVIKMYAWEKPFSKIISKIRQLEVNLIKLTFYIKGVYFFYIVFITTSLFLTIIPSVIFNQTMNAKSVFLTQTLFYGLGTCLTFMFPQGLVLLGEVNVSLNRITNFLLSDEVSSKVNSTIEKHAVVITDGSTKWDKKFVQNTFTNLNVEIEIGSLNAIVGSVGCGKSTLLQLILGELSLSTGDLNVSGTMSYASQDCWIFPASVRQNILFGSEMDEIRYKKVIKCCALNRDLKLFPFGDRTTVGERGASLSGGQKARICLARAVYKNADIYLLDDPLSAVDTHVGKQIFEQCIQQFLANKTVVLATHQLQYLNRVDYIIVLDSGKVKAQGTPSELEEYKSDFAKYLSQSTESLTERWEDSATQSQIDLSIVPTTEKFEESENIGSISSSTYKDYFLASKSYVLMVSSISFFVAAQLTTSASFYFLAYWVHMEQAQKYTNSEIQRQLYIYIYSGITAANILCTILRSVSFVNLTMKSSKGLHNFMLDNVVHASLKFFNANSSGPILNRFSKDLGTIDELLPNAMLVAIRTMLTILGVIGIIAIVNPWFILPTILMAVILYYLRRFYLMTNLNILRVEALVRSPLYGHVNASLQGLTTIRAFDVQRILTQEFYHHQDTHSTALYMALTTSRAFAYWMDILCFIYIAIITMYYTFGKETHGSNVGLVISQAFQLMGQLPWGVRQITDVENFMISVERVLEYNSIERERHIESIPEKKPPALWPTRGQIVFKNVYLKYSQSDPYVLKNLNFTIQPLEKIGIVGRTGAGKSSIVAALFQLIEIEGTINIDEVDIKNIGLHDLRKKMSIIPQDPVIFSGTVRYNLDPFDEYDDEILWKALEDVRLKEIVMNLSSELNTKISQDGSNFSVGQRQLLCLARAIVRDNKILILDEATANVDLDTDAIIQETIRKKFWNCTVLTVAHRLNTIMDSNKVLVMDAGKMVEFDHPHVLLQNKEGVFYNTVQQTERVMTNTLFDIAKESYTHALN